MFGFLADEQETQMGVGFKAEVGDSAFIRASRDYWSPNLCATKKFAFMIAVALRVVIVSAGMTSVMGC